MNAALRHFGVTWCLLTVGTQKDGGPLEQRERCGGVSGHSGALLFSQVLISSLQVCAERLRAREERSKSRKAETPRSSNFKPPDFSVFVDQWSLTLLIDKSVELRVRHECVEVSPRRRIMTLIINYSNKSHIIQQTDVQTVTPGGEI